MVPVLALLKGVVIDAIGQKIASKISGKPTPDKPGKSIFASKTIWGGLLLALGPWVTNKIGLDMGEWTETVHLFEQVVGMFLVYWGRRSVKTPIGEGK